MVARVYIVPEDPWTTPFGVMRVPKYFTGPNADLALAGISFSCANYGLEPVFLVGADVSGQAQAALAQKADVFAINQNLDATLNPTALANSKLFLEGMHLPAGWLTVNDSYRMVLREAFGLFQFLQQVGLKVFTPGVTLDTTLGNLAVGVTQTMLLTARANGVDTSAVLSSTTLRDALHTFSQHWRTIPVTLGPVVI